MDHKLLYYIVLAATLAAAFWRGARSERWGAVTALAGSLASTLTALNANWSGLIIQLLVIDLLVLASFWWLAIHSRRYWPYWVTGWQLVAVLVHLQRALFDDILPAPYALMTMYLAYPTLLLILFASLQNQRRPSEAMG
ncbi:MAG TPA: hypothetical protein PKC48_13850 [Sphingorhabdus sp.]|jgi:hypothetical protein|uniref:hypothetical protein n=1 Tax=Sphingorhabdus sp. TaxID=1902408 RepID=UPI002C9EA453|nr:hypothetical protein [Sphingorhabdus sp.]HMT40637.1 hypothetical protein [Sphingorhabdus sp.]HMU23378.1 hypothetical protein [Sphingorhabdus sp.]